MKKRFPWCTAAVTLLCVFLSTLAAVRPAVFELLAIWSQPAHFWQYGSGIFLHGIEPRWFFAVHLGLNLLGLIPLGLLVERRYGPGRWLALFFAEWAVTGVVFQLLHLGEHTYAVGISSIVYALAVAALPSLLERLKGRRLWKTPLFYYVIFEYLGLLSMLNPLNGMSTLLLHGSGLVVGGLFLLCCRKRPRT